MTRRLRKRERTADPARAEAHARKRERLLEAAVEVVRREGPGASMERIAREAGVTKPIIYRVFGDREGLTQALAERFAGELAESLASTIDEDVDDRTRIATSIDVYLSFIEREPAVVRFLIHRSVGEVATSGVALTPFVARVGSIVTNALGEALRARGLDSGAAEPWAYAIVGAVHLAGDWWLERRTMPRDRLVSYLTALVWDGMDAYRAPAEDAHRDVVEMKEHA